MPILPKSGLPDYLNETGDRLRLIADTLPAYIAYLDHDLRYRVVNRTYQEQFRLPLDRLLGRTASEVLGPSYPNVQRHLEAALAGTPQHFETHVTTAEGLRSLGITHLPDRGADGAIRGVIVHAVDITDRLRTEEELRITHQSLDLALSAASGIGLWDWDINADLVRANASFAELYGVDPAEAARGASIGSFFRNVHPDDIDHLQTSVAAAVRTREEFIAEYRLFQADGSIRWITARGRCTLAPDGTPSHLPGVILDVTERKLQEDALRQTEKLAAVGRLASSIAHEINNPLESVVNLLYLIETSATQDPAQAATYARLAQSEVARISQITTQTLRFFKQSTAPTRISLAELAASVLALYQGRLANSGITIEPRIRYETAVVCYEGEIRQVLNNLVGNAVDAMRVGGGRLCLRARPALSPLSGQPGVRITVADTGHGIPPAALRRIFEPFFTTKGMLGTGLGLWVTSGIIAKHNGHLGVRSQVATARHGTVFSLFLPDFETSDPGSLQPEKPDRLAPPHPASPASAHTSARYPEPLATFAAAAAAFAEASPPPLLQP